MHLNKKKRRADACTNDHKIAPSVICEELQGVNSSKNKHDPFGHYPEKQLGPGIDRREGNKNSKVQGRGTGKSRRVPYTPDRQQRNGRKQQHKIKTDVGLPADKAFNFAAEYEQHIHLDREPKQSVG